MKHILLILGILLSFLFFANCKEKKKENKNLQAGVVTFSKGDNKLVAKDGKEKAIQKEMLFLKEDSIITAKDGIVDIQLVDGVVIRVKQNSELKLKDILVTDNNNSMKAKLNLKSGKVFAKTNQKLNAHSSLEIATPTFVAGVRGTEFIVEDTEGKDQALVSDGSVNIETLDEQGNPTGKESTVEKGKKGVIEKDSIKNQDLSPDEMAELKEDSQSISSLTEDAKNRIQDIIRTIDEQKEINRENLEEQIQKNQTELNSIKEKNQQLLDEQKDKNKQLINETTDKANKQKSEIKDNTKAVSDEVKGKGKTELDEMKNKNKIDKSQFAPK